MKTNAIPGHEEGARSVVFWPADWRLGFRKASTHAIQQRMSSVQAMYSNIDSRIVADTLFLEFGGRRGLVGKPDQWQTRRLTSGH